MWIRSLNLKNVRSFAEAELNFSKSINILVGQNNAGKSTVLLPLLSLQEGNSTLTSIDVRLGEAEASAEIGFEDIDQDYFSEKFDRILHVYRKNNSNFPLLGVVNGREKGLNKIPKKEPFNFIYPYVSKRKVTSLNEQVNDSVVESVESTFSNLNAKIDRLSNPEFLPAHKLYMRACEEILGFKVTTAHTNQGKRAVYTVRNMDNIPLLSMGEGVMNILGLVVHLAIAENKLFLIEEPENDIHPKALKALLDLIIQKSETNQFIITTHSNIVLKRLGSSEGAKVFKISSHFEERLPTATVHELDSSSESRRMLLSELGYELHDVDIWDAWLILEESSAEKIIREYLIPWFVPSLSARLRTFSARTLSEVEVKFRDFNDLFVFLHLAPTYKNKAWVVIDGGSTEEALAQKLRDTYSKSGWEADQFLNLSEHDFESYYPNAYSEKIESIKIMPKKEKREAKRLLLEEVEAAIRDDECTMKELFQTSAKEVIEILKTIEMVLSEG